MATEAPDGSALEREDDAARVAALDVRRSFLVQAPAGSGKTELIIQRYLALLAQVERPEAIIAVTFTRKAAGEMRERILAALRDAELGTPVATAHAQRTRELASAALRRDAQQQWDLVAHPARLVVSTIDALCARLAAQAPVTTGLGAAPRFVERARPLYTEAIRRALAAVPADDAAGRLLVAQVDGDVDALIELLAELLARREQWLPMVLEHHRGRLRPELLDSLAIEVDSELQALASAFPPAVVRALPALQHGAAAELADDATLAAALRAAAAQGGLPRAQADALGHWQALADWLLTRQSPAQFRRVVDKRGGFPAAGTGAGAAARGAAKQSMQALLADCRAVPGFAAALAQVRVLPPADYGPRTWSLIDALFSLLPRCAAELQRVFRARRSIDFTEGLLRALAALGQDDEPEELLLRLDHAVAHLLIDEFQDTSYPQLELMQRLTAGWTPDDGRTLFAVGDPMQSIYRFRGAEVRLFLDAQATGAIGGVAVTPLVLRRNFRSQAGLVDWVNTTFPAVLGARSDPWRGVVAFASALAQRPRASDAAVTVDFVTDPAAEAQAVVAVIRAADARGVGAVAVLVRARALLACILPALRQAGIGYTAVDLDTLAQRAAIRDLVALTHAIAQPADRLAWLAVLRAPWCGLAASDLAAVAAAVPTSLLLPAVLAPDQVAGLSADGCARVGRVADVLRPTLASGGSATLAARVRGAWLALGGPAVVAEAIDLAAADTFFALLRAHERGGDVADWDALVDALEALPVAGDDFGGPGATAVRAAPVQVMTLHRAKGLEFDTVVMPGLSRRPPAGERPLLRWRRRPQGLLLAPARPRGGDDDPVYGYLTALAEGEADAELGRLLYVGCTRARQRLHLIAVAAVAAPGETPPRWASAPAGSALASLGAGITAAVPDAVPATPAPAAARASAPRLARLPTGWVPSPPGGGLAPPVAVKPGAAAAIAFDWAEATARHVGVVAHRAFAALAAEGIAAWTPARVTRQRARWRVELATEGVPGESIDTAVAAVADAISGLVADPRGRWLFAAGHRDARSEWALTGVVDGSIVHSVIDRSFVADGVRWIVDFKTGSHEGGEVAAFIAREELRYRTQLERYARLLQPLEPRPIRLALYYPRLPAWCEWAYRHDQPPDS
jgi:ATP-dependent exoDNAse (exonuclease V) beta subunit